MNRLSLIRVPEEMMDAHAITSRPPGRRNGPAEVTCKCGAKITGRNLREAYRARKIHLLAAAITKPEELEALARSVSLEKKLMTTQAGRSLAAMLREVLEARTK